MVLKSVKQSENGLEYDFVKTLAKFCLNNQPVVLF